MLKAGFAKVDITPRVGVELSGFGPYINRHSKAVRDRLWASAMAIGHGDDILLVIACDLIGISVDVTSKVRELVNISTGLPEANILINCSHTHSGPATVNLQGWGDVDAPYMEILPHRIARAGIAAISNLAPARISHAEVPCEGIALNREYDKDAPPLKEVLDENWRPAKPELTDRTCHVITLRSDERLLGFVSYYGCHPVVCCADSHYIHGDYAGVATNLLEREHPGSVGLFLQGAQGDVNSACVHKSEQDSLLALDVLAGRYARAVRQGIHTASPILVNRLIAVRKSVCFTRKAPDMDRLRKELNDLEAAYGDEHASDSDHELRTATVRAQALRKFLAHIQEGCDLEPSTEIQGFQIGPLALLGAPFEIFQAIKNEVISKARAPIPLVLGLTNDCLGYATDRTKSEKGGYAADYVPIILGQLPFAHVYRELADALLAVDAALDDINPASGRQ